MYLNHYHFIRPPFDITPDPRFLFLSSVNKEALASIIYGVEGKRGFIVVTGEVGVGKTTILRAFLDKVDKERVKIIYIFNPAMSFKALLKAILQEFNNQSDATHEHEMVACLQEKMIEEYKNGRNVVLIIDEAQNMPIRTLEKLRMLSNLETSTDKLIQIVLSAQPEFEDLIDKYQLRQLKQRIAVRSRIEPFGKKESLAYIRHRLEMAGVPEVNALFTGGALKKIISHAKGVPRTINILCDNALLTGFGYQKDCIDTRIVAEVIEDMEGKIFYPSRRVAAVSLAFSVLIAISGTAMFHEKIFPELGRQVSAFTSVTPVFSKIYPKQMTKVYPIQKAKPEPVEALPATTSDPPPSSQKLPGLEQDAVISSQDHRGAVLKRFPVKRFVKKGNTLFGMMADVYGFIDERLVRLVQQYNPQISNVNVIAEGDEIIFPEPLSREEAGLQKFETRTLP